MLKLALSEANPHVPICFLPEVAEAISKEKQVKSLVEKS